MAKLNYNKLIEPYAAPTVPGAPPRTPEGQRKWLTERKGIPEAIVDHAMQVVYSKLAAGKTFKDGHELDRYLLSECVKQALAAEKRRVRWQQRNIHQIQAPVLRKVMLKVLLWSAATSIISFFLGMGFELWLLTR